MWHAFVSTGNISPDHVISGSETFTVVLDYGKISLFCCWTKQLPQSRPAQNTQQESVYRLFLHNFHNTGGDRHVNIECIDFTDRLYRFNQRRRPVRGRKRRPGKEIPGAGADHRTDGFLTLVNRTIWQKPHICGFFYVKFIKF